ncbi:enoyl-CoA hydratase/isomerase family protein [Brevibacillus migulae]|uniref:enoyl-CoA hydratase/isomerase family protein n=1 Tax=Brevibacillus migulae TaxID=1644114 RepID=UPI00106E361A|nr:enoyl-CoA hydratase/isomerase family protein [Brevibacillus migulae]
METIKLEQEDGIAILTLNRPEVRNAINMKMVQEINEVLARLERDPSIKVVVFTGSGSTFISGGDLAQFGAVRGFEEALPLLSRVGDLLQTITNFSKPVIAMINGTAVGGGCEFAAACHIRVASEEAKLGFVQIGMHITTGWGGGSRLLSLLPEAKALTLLLTGEKVSAYTALSYGLVDFVHPAAQLREQTLTFAAKMAKQPLTSITSYMKLLAWKREGLPMEERIRLEIEQCAGLWGSEQHVGAIERFFRKE